jgi:hypothetical protein
MKTIRNMSVFFAALLILAGAESHAANIASGSVKIGYTFIDEDGSQAVNQPTYNVYEGIGLSLNQWQFNWDSGLNLKADLNNITLNNRNLRLSLGKPGRFGVSAFNNQYRRVYQANALNFTRRNASGIQANYQPSRFFKFNGGFGLIDKHGTDYFILPAIDDNVSRSSDWTQKSYNFGAQCGDRYGLVRVDYRRFDFTDNTPAALDRSADQINLMASSTIPKLKQVYLSGGLNYRKDKFDATSTELKTSQYWGATNIYFTPSLLLDYRIIFATTQRNSPKRTIDNVSNTVALGKTWAGKGGARVGYENRVSDDFVNRTSSDGLLAGGWLKPTTKWYFSASLFTRKADVTDGVTLLGDESRTSHAIKARYTEAAWGDVTARWESRIRKNDDLSSEVRYNVVSGELNLSRPKYGRFNITYSYYTGDYKNQSATTSYEFLDHVLTGHIYPVAYKNIAVDFGGTYYRSTKGQDIEKFSLDFGAAFTFLDNHHLQARYRVFNFDDFHFTDKYYTANIVEVCLIKDMQL